MAERRFAGPRISAAPEPGSRSTRTISGTLSRAASENLSLSAHVFAHPVLETGPRCAWARTRSGNQLPSAPAPRTYLQSHDEWKTSPSMERHSGFTAGGHNVLF